MHQYHHYRQHTGQLTWNNSLIVCQLTFAMRFSDTGMGRALRWALMAIRSLVTALEMAACIVGEKARGVDDVGWSASTSTRTYRRDPGACKCARTIGTTSQHTCWVERPGPA